ncbi:hypothetical protein Q5P01_012930 [Channa striata]|uniref:Uncharacterized protein n=1 Tax=Channa striata TaxID=64152 RepID=A0AA88MQN5_CHASR|nr:hypothetical protein Q5P01_012930 [Channa striata]
MTSHPRQLVTQPTAAAIIVSGEETQSSSTPPARTSGPTRGGHVRLVGSGSEERRARFGSDRKERRREAQSVMFS